MEFDIKINKLDCVPLMGNLINVVTNIHWSLIGKLNGNEHQIDIITYLSSGELNSSNFIEYKNLTLDIAMEWLKASLGKGGIDQYKSLIITYFDENKNISTINPDLPWI
jgi:hypothetical protein